MMQTASSARLIVCERTGRWAVLLRRNLAEAGVRVWEIPLLDECAAEIVVSPASIIVVELTNRNRGEVLRTVRDWNRDYPLLRWVAVADRSLAEYEWLMREAGAVHFTTSPRRAASLVQLVCRHMAQIPSPPRSFTDRIWDSLPWAER